MTKNKGVRAVLLTVAMAVAVGSVSAGAGAADARPTQNKSAILGAIL